MKPCTYCGRENEAAATHCGECGTEFTATVAEAELVQPRDSSTLKTFITIVGVMFLGVSLYLLSFGPVFRWTATVTNAPPPGVPTATPSNGATVVYTSISIPGWVGVIYYPAFRLMGGNAGTLGDLYHRYIEWWEKPSPLRSPTAGRN